MYKIIHNLIKKYKNYSQQMLTTYVIFTLCSLTSSLTPMKPIKSCKENVFCKFFNNFITIIEAIIPKM